MQKNIFISYSHEDQAFVLPIVQLLRVNSKYVFLDRDSIKPGEKWKDVIEAAISKANLFVILWCHHAKKSSEVKKEYELAVNQDKAIMPVLLDSTKLPESVAAYQWVDFRHIVHLSHMPDLSVFENLKEIDSIPRMEIDARMVNPPKSASNRSLWTYKWVQITLLLGLYGLCLYLYIHLGGSSAFLQTLELVTIVLMLLYLFWVAIRRTLSSNGSKKEDHSSTTIHKYPNQEEPKVEFTEKQKELSEKAKEEVNYYRSLQAQRQIEIAHLLRSEIEKRLAN